MKKLKKVLKITGVVILAGIIISFISDMGSDKNEDGFNGEYAEDANLELLGEPATEGGEETEMSEDEIYNLLMNDTDNSPISITDITTEEKNAGGVYPVTQISYKFTNNLERDIREFTVGIVAWDENKLPIPIGEETIANSEYKYVLQGTFDNLASNGESVSTTTEVDCQGIRYLNIILLSYEDYEGNQWENPLKDYIVSMSEKPVDAESMMFYEVENNSNQ